jgi:acyl CoA:acetate/3-ketoacid CoA transferase
VLQQEIAKANAEGAAAREAQLLSQVAAAREAHLKSTEALATVNAETAKMTVSCKTILHPAKLTDMVVVFVSSKHWPMPRKPVRQHLAMHRHGVHRPVCTSISVFMLPC